MDRTHVRRRRSALVGIGIALAIGFVSGRAVAGPARPETAKVYIVQPGDSLWRIAQRLAGPGGDPRPLVDELIVRNHATGGALTVGERLVLPKD
jgi:hypothetical protein